MEMIWENREKHYLSYILYKAIKGKKILQISIRYARY